MIGKTLAHYEITSELGKGGMGEVYRARDTKLNRDVALKVLPGAFIAEPDRLARFQREAEVLASLNHPNIAHIYGLEDSGDTTALVLELVEGPTLADRIAQRAIPLDEALPIAKQIADALEAAHERGIIHRDLKPANIKVTPEGVVKVLDYGLAKALEGPSRNDPSESPTMATAVTGMGVILGTAAYMSPEQARGRAVDKRADIWAFGVVLFEMLSGQRGFKGDDVSETLASVLKDTLPLDTLPAGTPARLKRLIGRCLDRDVRTRLRDIGEARVKLARIETGEPDTAASDPGAAAAVGAGGGHGTGQTLPFIGMSLLAVVGLAGWIWSATRTRSGQDPVAVRFAFSATPATELTTAVGRNLALSPDGNTLVYSTADSTGVTHLFERAIDDLQQLPIAGTEGAASPFFSSDGREIGFVVGNQLKKIPVGGGTATVLADVDGFRGATWGPNGIVVSANGNLALIRSEGGGLLSLARGDSIRGFWPVLLPGGESVVYSSYGIADGPLAVARLSTGQVTQLDVSGNVPLGVVVGDLIFARSDGQLFAVQFDAGTLRATGSARAVESEAARNPGNGETKAAVSEGGTLAYATGSGLVQVVVADLRGVPRALPVRPGRLHFPRYSPDGKKFAAGVSSTGRTDIYVYDIESGAVQRLTADGTVNERPEWSSDGARIIFKSDRAGANATLWWQAADGSGIAEQLVASAGKDVWQGQLSPDGKTVLYRTGGGGTGDIWHTPIGGGTDGTAVAATRFNELGPRFSPDGHWVAYQSNESGSYQVYVRPFPGPGAAVPVSVTGGEVPVWSPDGRKLFFVNGRQLVAAPVVTGPSFSVTARDVLFDGNFVVGGGHAGYHVAPDGKSFLILLPVAADAEKIVVVRNWAAELRAGSARAPKR